MVWFGLRRGGVAVQDDRAVCVPEGERGPPGRGGNGEGREWCDMAAAGGSRFNWKPDIDRAYL